VIISGFASVAICVYKGDKDEETQERASLRLCGLQQEAEEFKESEVLRQNHGRAGEGELESVVAGG